MIPTKWCIAALVIFGLVVSGATCVLSAETKPPAEPQLEDTINIPVRNDGIVLVLGREIKDGEKVPANAIITVRIDGQDRRYRRLKVGDRVEEGQVIGRLDDRLVRMDVEVSKVHLATAKSRLNYHQKRIDDMVSHSCFRRLEKK